MMPETYLSRAPRAAAVALTVSAALLAGCSSLKDMGTSVSTLGGLITPYKIDILQGNVVVREQVQALQTGMPREQVQAILGTPLVASVFHADRWDYVFTFKRQGQEPQMRRVTVFFDGDALAGDSSSTTSSLPSGHSRSGPCTSASKASPSSRASHCSGGSQPVPGRSIA